MLYLQFYRKGHILLRGYATLISFVTVMGSNAPVITTPLIHSCNNIKWMNGSYDLLMVAVREVK